MKVMGIRNCVSVGLIFGPKRDENGEWRRLHNEELHSSYRLPNIVWKIKMGRSCSQNEINFDRLS